MTIPEYQQVMEEIKKLRPELKKFLSDICISVGHEMFKDPNLFADVCTRCGGMVSWMEQQGALSKIATAMSSPLRTRLDYSSVVKKIIKIDQLDVSDLPIYDKDLSTDDPG